MHLHDSLSIKVFDNRTTVIPSVPDIDLKKQKKIVNFCDASLSIISPHFN